MTKRREGAPWVDMVAFLAARLGEEHYLAHKFVYVDGGEWMADELARLWWFSDPPKSRSAADPIIQHAARYNPARVLREVEAKRRLLDTAERLLADAAEMAADAGSTRYRPGEWMTYMATGRAILACLGWPYLDHPEFPAGWRAEVSRIVPSIASEPPVRDGHADVQ